MKIHGVPQQNDYSGCFAAIVAGLIVLVFGVVPTVAIVWVCWHFIAKWW